MIAINRAMKDAAVKAGASSRLGLAILAYYGRTSYESESLEGLDAIAQAAREAGESVFEDLDRVIRFDHDDFTIGQIVDGTEWAQHVGQETKEMPAHSNCGADCLSLILRADKLLDDMADVRDFMVGETISGGDDVDDIASVYAQEALMRSVARQCSVFVVG